MKQILKNLTLTKITQAVAMISLSLGIALAPALMLAPQVGHAQLIDRFVNDCPEETGVRCNEGGLGEIFVTIINWALGIGFIIAVVFLIYGGFRYILSGGNEESAKTGRQAIFNALIGVIIIVLSYVIVQIVYRFVAGGSGGGAFGS